MVFNTPKSKSLWKSYSFSLGLPHFWAYTRGDLFTRCIFNKMKLRAYKLWKNGQHQILPVPPSAMWRQCFFLNRQRVLDRKGRYAMLNDAMLFQVRTSHNCGTPRPFDTACLLQIIAKFRPMIPCLSTDMMFLYILYISDNQLIHQSNHRPLWNCDQNEDSRQQDRAHSSRRNHAAHASQYTLFFAVKSTQNRVGKNTTNNIQLIN